MSINYKANSVWIVIIYAIAVAMIMICAGALAEPGWYLFVIPVLAWTVVPLLLFPLFIYKVNSDTFKLVLVCLQCLMFTISLLLYFDAFYIHPGTFNFLIFMVLPVLELPIVLVTGLGLIVFEWVASKHVIK